MLKMHIHSFKYLINHSFFQSWIHVLVVLCLDFSSFPPSFPRLTMVLLHKSVSLYCTKKIMISLHKDTRVTNWVKNSWLDRGSMQTASKRLKCFRYVKIKEMRKGWIELSNEIDKVSNFDNSLSFGAKQNALQQIFFKLWLFEDFFIKNSIWIFCK